jgi:N-acetylglucosaminyldiphosphoundecaprenol N-acetyl-beta-D-mannosaminyltransferase
MMMISDVNKMQFFGLHLWKWRYQDFLEIVKYPQKKTLVFTPNPEILVWASKDEEFMYILEKADYLTPDANGLYVASLIQEGRGYLVSLIETFFYKKRLLQKYGELIQWSNLTKHLVEFAQEYKKNILIIDNYRIENPENPFEVKKKEIQSQLPNLIIKRFPDLSATIIFDRDYPPEKIAELIVEKNISYVFSCIGMKEQEKRLLEIFAHLRESERVVWLGVGSSFDYLLWLQRRAPVIFQKLGLEWLYRLILSPRSRYRRIYTALVEFPRLIRKVTK